ncbi:Rhodanese-related sulfurtransferase [Roseivivax lentus]|uniref:Rhodanese-related sulfurtransferase n=1 Tax=Roseivivax lentus TaxID=633194 RepID=A0A1N7NFU4_9RHOB|nr:Rhodanese-related sulfurtransferase [Roseivivax lentus]
MTETRRIGALALVLGMAIGGLSPNGAEAEEAVNITRDLPSVTVETGGGAVEIKRIQDVDNVLTGAFARTSRPCPDFCIQPMQPAPGVTTIGELELLAALQDPEVTVIDSRVRPDWETGTIPGAISMPYTEMPDRLHELGCEPDFDGFECGPDVGAIVLFCNGPWCGQSPTAIRRIIEAGFPAEKISYYRWGMQGWRLLGLTVAGGS